MYISLSLSTSLSLYIYIYIGGKMQDLLKAYQGHVVSVHEVYQFIRSAECTVIRSLIIPVHHIIPCHITHTSSSYHVISYQFIISVQCTVMT